MWVDVAIQLICQRTVHKDWIEKDLTKTKLDKILSIDRQWTIRNGICRHVPFSLQTQEDRFYHFLWTFNILLNCEKVTNCFHFYQDCEKYPIFKSFDFFTIFKILQNLVFLLSWDVYIWKRRWFSVDNLFKSLDFLRL